MQTITVPWGTQSLEIKLPDNWEVEVLKNKETPSTITDMENYLPNQLENPIGTSPLGQKLNKIKEKNGKITFIVDDRTRPTPVARIMPVLLEYLEEHEFPLENTHLLIATGIHRLMEPDEIKERVSPIVYEKITCENHNVDDLDSLTVTGTVSDDIPVEVNKHVAHADLVITISTIESHGQAGFGGGLKNIIPGVSGRQTIDPIHNMKYLSKEKMSEAGSLKKDNRMRQLIDECGMKAANEVFLVNTILNVDQPIAIMCGDPLKAHEEGVKMVRNLFGHDLDELADVVITDSHPLDADFRAGTKSMSNSLNACKKGGVIISLLRATEGWGDVTVPEISKLKGFIMRNFPLGFVGKAINKSAGSPDQSGGMLDLVKMTRNFHPHLYLPTITENEPLINMGFQIFDDLDLLLTSVKEYFSKKYPDPNRKLKVIVLPFGAITFPFPPEK